MDRSGNYELFENCVSTGRTESYKPYTLLGARLNWSTGAFRLYAEGDNLLNRIYYDHGNIPQPGLWLRAGLNVDVEW